MDALGGQSDGTTMTAHQADRPSADSPLLVPSDPEQRAIATVLDAADDAIRKTEQLLAKLDHVKQGLLHDLLTRGSRRPASSAIRAVIPEQFRDTAWARCQGVGSAKRDGPR